MLLFNARIESFTNTKSIKKALKIAKNFASNFSCVTNSEKEVFFLDNDDLVQLKPPKINAKDTLAAGGMAWCIYICVSKELNSKL